MVFGAILGAVGSVAGSVAQNRANKKAYRAQMASIEQAKDYLLEGESKATPYLREMIAAIESAKQEALGHTAQSEFAGYRALGDAYQLGLGRVDQRLASRGLYNSTTALAAQRGVRGQYARDVSQLGASLGSARARIAMQAGQGVAAGNQALGNLVFNTGRGLSSIQAGVQYQAPQGLSASYGALGAQVGDLLGGAYGAWDKWRTNRAGQKAGQRFTNMMVGASARTTAGAIGRRF